MPARDFTPLTKTNDDRKAADLERMLSNFTTSYKFFFLKAIFDEAMRDTTYVSFDLLAARMVAGAWHPALFFRLNFGASDQLTKIANLVHSRYGISSNASQEEILATLAGTKDAGIRRELSKLCNYVPYRLIRPFYAQQFKQVRELYGTIPENQVNGLVMQFNLQNPDSAPYVIQYEGITINPDWAEYFRDNRQVIQEWFDKKLAAYLQARNPEVPSIALRLHLPVHGERDLENARQWWRDVIADHSIREIYSANVLEADDLSTHGSLAIDHFVPWSLVLHDEPWNLVPTLRSTNNAKGNQVVRLDPYLDMLCVQQFDALLTLRDTRRHHKVVEGYLAIDPNVYEYEDSERSFDAFASVLSREIVPLHQAAVNQGFPLWDALSA